MSATCRKQLEVDITTGNAPTLGRLITVPVADRLDLLAPPVAAVAPGLRGAGVVEIDPALADTAALCEAMDLAPQASANCVIVAGRRGQAVRYAACVVLATTRADVNSLVRRRLEARRASFADQQTATSATGMEYGGITPVGLPSDWLLLVDQAVAETDLVCIGSGVRHSKIILPGAALAELPGAEVTVGLGKPI